MLAHHRTWHDTSSLEWHMGGLRPTTTNSPASQPSLHPRRVGVGAVADGEYRRVAVEHAQEDALPRQRAPRLAAPAPQHVPTFLERSGSIARSCGFCAS